MAILKIKEGASVLGAELTESVAVSSLESDVTFHETQYYTQILLSWSSPKTSDVTCTSRYGGGRSRSLVPFGPLGRYDVSFNLLVSKDRPSRRPVSVSCSSQMSESSLLNGRDAERRGEEGKGRKREGAIEKERLSLGQTPRPTGPVAAANICAVAAPLTLGRRQSLCSLGQ